MNKKALFCFLVLLVMLLFVYNKSVLFFFQNYFLALHHEQSAAYSKKYKSGAAKLFNNHKIFSKVWAHRVDRLERYLYLQGAFKGFEVDLVFDSVNNYFDIGHPPATSIHLSFEKYLQIPERNENLFWMDLKNLDSLNVMKVMASLNQLDSVYRIRNRVIIESGNIKELSKISSQGYFTSFYYSYASYSELMAKNEGALLDKIDAVSQSDAYNDTFKNKFPLKPRLLWALSIENYLSHSLFSSFDKDTSVLVYLVNIKSPYYR